MAKRTLVAGTIAIVAIATLAVVAAPHAARTKGRMQLATPLRASDFSAVVDNPWFPLKPGTRYVYTGVKDGEPSRDVVTVTHRTKRIDGVRCIVVQDRLYVRGHLGERTTDWYSQDKQGNVWYFGESTAELDKSGAVSSTAGTWTAGVRGARPGIYMPAHPRVGMSGRQEFLKGRAEDHFRVIGLFATIAAPNVKNALLTEEWTPLEPGVLDHKTYVRGIGTVLEQTERGGNERNELVSLTIGG
jgi:hypothetical protein